MKYTKYILSLMFLASLNGCIKEDMSCLLYTSAGIGFIILFGIVSINSILLTALMQSLLQQSRNIGFAIDEAVRIRLRAVLMISLMGSAGLLPAALSTGMGSEVQKPLAVMYKYFTL